MCVATLFEITSEFFTIFNVGDGGEKGSNIITNFLIYHLLSPCRGWSERGQIRFIKKESKVPKEKKLGQHGFLCDEDQGDLVIPSPKA